LLHLLCAGRTLRRLAGLDESRAGRVPVAGLPVRADPTIPQPVLDDRDLENALRHGFLTPSDRGPCPSVAAPEMRTVGRRPAGSGSAPPAGTGTAAPGGFRFPSPVGSGSCRYCVSPAAAAPQCRPVGRAYCPRRRPRIACVVNRQ